MSHKLDQHPGEYGKTWVLLAAVLALLLWAFAMATWAAAQKVASATARSAIVPSMDTPPTLAPPPGNRIFLVGHAVGTQGYICLPTSTGASWTVNGSRPEATLFSGLAGHDVQIISHFLSPDTNPNEFAPKPLPFGSPTWQSSKDSSTVWGQALASVPAGSHTSCPNAGAISCLLLQSIGSAKGPAGGTIMTGATFIQRLNTQGGSAPVTGCSAASEIGRQALVPYSADYYFFRQGKENLKNKRTRFELFLPH